MSVKEKEIIEEVVKGITKQIKEGAEVAKEDYICKTCKYDNTEDCFWYKKYGYRLDDYATCDGWTDPEEVELTDEEKADIEGDRKAHEIMEREGHIR